jgi:hypothetical protein
MIATFSTTSYRQITTLAIINQKKFQKEHGCLLMRSSVFFGAGIFFGHFFGLKERNCEIFRVK